MPGSEGWALRFGGLTGELLQNDVDKGEKAPSLSSSSSDDLADEFLHQAEDGAATATAVIKMAKIASKRMAKLGVVDPELEKLARYRRSKTGKRSNNASRDFHRYVHRDEKVFPVKISKARFLIKKKIPNKSGRRISKQELVDYPFIALSSWMESILPSYPHFFLGGHLLGQCDAYGDMLEDYWNKFRAIEPHHPIFQDKSVNDRRRAIPIAVHGDEGRGLNKVPVLICSYQVVIPHNQTLNIKKHSFTTRLLASLMPATWYAPKDASIFGLSEALCKDLEKLFHEGVEIQVDETSRQTFFAVLVAIKGDWPWLRKCMALKTGFRSRRICHYCPSEEICIISCTVFQQGVFSCYIFSMFCIPCCRYKGVVECWCFWPSSHL